MLVRFSSVATEPITMFGDVAIQLIKMLGATGAVPGAITAEDIPAALRRLRQQLQVHAAPKPNAPSTKQDEDDDEEEHDAPIDLATRAGPLIDLLERASAGDVPLMWEAL